MYPLVVDMLERSGAAYRLHSHPPLTTVEEAFVKAPRLTHNLLKTVVFRIQAGDWVLAAVAGECAWVTNQNPSPYCAIISCRDP
ncbi:MAG: hypothetical protein PVI39_03465 [Desulfobacteraceae bacterium]